MGSRFIIIFCFFAFFIVLCLIRLFNLQIISGKEYKEIADNRLIRAYPIKAPRGEIVDTYGRPLVTNSMGYYVQIQSMDKENSSLNASLETLISIFKKEGLEYYNEFPIKEVPYKFVFENVEDQNAAVQKWKKENKLEDYATAEEIVDYYAKRYNISSKHEKEIALEIISVRYTMEKKGFGIMTPYIFANDVEMGTVQKITESGFALNGVTVEIEPIREYVNGAMAAHILGRTGIIYQEEYAKLKDQGYGMNDIIGKDGIEKVLEKYLKGRDGYRSVEQTKSGDVLQILSIKEPETDNYAVLTIDADLQQRTEESLAKSIANARADKGYDCYSGAAVAVEVETGGILAMASLPNYDPAEYTKKYNELLKDPKNPLFNRALNGMYTPGSTFKPLTAIAALEEGIIGPSTLLETKGKYTYYAPSYQPTCLIWKNTGQTHGNINVSEAIGVSCNYFFYEMGRLLTIDKMNEYANYFGLGLPTGVELSESDGIVAGPAYREKIGTTWYPGDTLQAAIGQSDNMYTPAQLASYVSTILNKGNRYALHLVKEVRKYDTGEIVFRNGRQLLSQYQMSDATFNAVKDGMRRVVADGTARAVFEDFPIEVGGKTGTAEVGGGSDTVLFVGFAPYDNPKIAVAVVLEHGATSRYAAQVARDIFECYLRTADVEDDVVYPNSLIR